MRKLLALCWLFLALLPLIGFSQQASSDFKLEKIIGTPISFPYGVAVDAKGYMYVLERGYVTKLDPQGIYIGQIDVRSSDPAKPNGAGYGLALDAAGNIYIADYGYGEIRKFSPSGQLLLAFQTGGSSSNGIFGIATPQNLAVDAAGNIYVVGDVNKGGVRKFNAQGQLQWDFTVPGSTNSTLVNPKDVALDHDGKVFVLTSTSNVCQLSADGQLERQFPVKVPGYNERDDVDALLDIDAKGNFYTTISQGNSVRKFDPAGKFLSLIGNGLSGSTRTCITLDAADNLYATTRDHGGNSKLYKYNPAGTEISKWGNLTRWRGVAQDGAGNVYVTDGRDIIKRNPAGQENVLASMSSGTGSGQTVYELSSLTCDIQGNLYALSSASGRVIKFDAQGHSVTPIISSYFQGHYSEQKSLAVDAAGNIYVNNHYGNLVHKLNPRGEHILQFGTSGTRPGQLSGPRAIAIDSRGFIYVADRNGYRVQKFSPSGAILRENKNLPPYDNSTAVCTAALSVDASGTVFLGTSLEGYVQVYDPSGRLSRRLPFMSDLLSVNPQGTQFLRLYSDIIQFYTTTIFPKKLSSQITGRIFQDLNQDCVAQPDEPGLANIPVVAEPGNYYGYSDENGNYIIDADTGSYMIRQLLPTETGRTIQQNCVWQPTVHVKQYGSNYTGANFGNQVTISPYLSVSVASNRRRRCFRNTTTVAYSNTGFAAATNAKVMVELPEHVLFISANVPHTRDAKGTYVFDVGTLAPNQHGTITIQDSVACGNSAIRGLTVCTKAWITPVNTYQAPPTWNEASMTVSGSRQSGNQARFIISNTGKGATTDSLNIRVYQDAQLALQHRYSLAATDSLVLRVPATGQVVRVEADQPLGHPLKTMASANVELSTTSGLPNAAMLAFPPDDREPEKSVDCQPIVDSYDPNDKQVIPAGLTAQHYTPTNTPLRYQIRFQNTGTDVAYQVVVVDTLAAELDISTLHVGATSHPYRLNITGKTRPVLTFTFDNILLPESKRDELGSNGFVQFTIQPKSGLAPKTSVENYADIFFDYNEPIRTNTTLNRLYDMPPVLASQQLQGPAVIVSPTISSFSPAAGRLGTIVTLVGHHFSPQASGNRVLFQGTEASVLSTSATTLTVRVPAGATTAQLRVLTSDGSGRSLSPFTVYQPPTLTSFSAEEGVPGAVVTLYGTHFSPLATQDTVLFNGLPAQVLRATATSLQVVVPQGATRGIVQVKTLGGQVGSAKPFMVWYQPTLTTLTPGKARAGATLTLTGTNFAETASRNIVTFGGVPAEVLQASATRLLVRVPALPQLSSVQVQTPGGTAVASQPFTFLPAPNITSFSPTEGQPGTLVTITGQHFLTDGRADTVYLQGIPLPVLNATPTSCLVQVPSGARTGSLIMVGAGGQAQSAQQFVVPELSIAEAITVYPNPTNRRFTLNWLPATFAVEQVRVYNTVGALILQQDLRTAVGYAATIDLAPNRPGLYVVVIQTAKGTVIKRITLL
jgi:sugar lactone lactonase YvrE